MLEAMSSEPSTCVSSKLRAAARARHRMIAALADLIHAAARMVRPARGASRSQTGRAVTRRERPQTRSLRPRRSQPRVASSRETARARPRPKGWRGAVQAQFSTVNSTTKLSVPKRTKRASRRGETPLLGGPVAPRRLIQAGERVRRTSARSNLTRPNEIHENSRE